MKLYKTKRDFEYKMEKQIEEKLGLPNSIKVLYQDKPDQGITAITCLIRFGTNGYIEIFESTKEEKKFAKKTKEYLSTS
jgi:hypothetical protein